MYRTADLMFIVFRDALGVQEIAVEKYGFSFLDGFVYFEDADTGHDMKINVNQLVEIHACEW